MQDGVLIKPLIPRSSRAAAGYQGKPELIAKQLM
jgi:hypothetical protein